MIKWLNDLVKWSNGDLGPLRWTSINLKADTSTLQTSVSLTDCMNQPVGVTAVTLLRWFPFSVRHGPWPPWKIIDSLKMYISFLRLASLSPSTHTAISWSILNTESAHTPTLRLRRPCFKKEPTRPFMFALVNRAVFHPSTTQKEKLFWLFYLITRL